MTTSSGAVRIVHLGLLAAAIVAGVVVWLLVSSGSRGRIGSADESSPTAAPAAPPRQPEPPMAASRAITPRVLAESEPAEGAASSRAGALEIEVIGPKGRPSANAGLVLTRGKDVLGAATTDARGIAKLASGEGEAGLLIVPVGAPRHDTTVSIASGRHRVELPPGVSISGVVEVDRAAPSGPLRLWADSEEIPWGERSDQVWRALKGETMSWVETSPSGAFEFDGLRPSSEWKFGPKSVGYRLDEIAVDGKASFVAIAPATGVVVRLSRYPVIRGRVVSGPNHAPVGGARMSVDYKSPTSGMTRGDRARDDGRFEIPGANEYERDLVIQSITIELQGPTGIGEKTIVLEPPPDRDLDLGDVELPAARSVRYEVKDPGGAPIAGAFVVVRNAELDPATKTDARGLGTALVPADAKSFFVGTVKFEIQEVPLPTPLPELLPVVLQPTAGLEVQVRTVEGTAPQALRVRLKSQAQRLWTGAGEPYGPHATTLAAGATPISGGSSGSLGCSYLFPVPESGRVVASGLVTGVPITVAVMDQLEHELATTLVTLAPGEWETLELRAKQASRSLKGRVRDAAGKPIGGARLIVTSEELSSRCSCYSTLVDAKTDADGRFALTGLFEGPMHLAVDKAGWVPLIRRDFALPPEGEELDFVLETGFTLTVKVVGSDGVPIKDLDVSVTAPGYPAWCQDNKAPGVCVFTDFPKDATATISTQWAAKVFTRTVLVKGDTTATITMPAAGKILVDVTAIAGDAFLLELRAPGLEEGQRPSWIFDAPTSGSPRTWVAAPVLPGDYEAFLFNTKDETPVAAAEPLKVQAGETTRVVFRKP